MLDIIIEIVTDLFQPLMFCGFLYLFMEKPDNRKRNVICFLLFSTVMFGILLYSSLVEYYMIINDLMFLAVLEIYSLLCLRGNIFSRIFMPLIAFLINTVISFAFSYFVSFFYRIYTLWIGNWTYDLQIYLYSGYQFDWCISFFNACKI